MALRVITILGYTAFLIVGVRVQERAKVRREVAEWMKLLRSYPGVAWDRWYATHAGRAP